MSGEILYVGRAVSSTGWFKSKKSFALGNCVEVNLGEEVPAREVRVRNSRDPQGPELVFTAQEWAAFLHGARHGEFDLLA